MSRSTELHAWIEAHDPADADERHARARMLALLELGERSFDRGTFDPGHFTASAFVVRPVAGEVLLIHHDKLGRWLQPGGHVEPGDPDLLAAARRETLEETGIAARPARAGAIFDLDVHPIPARGGEPEHLHFDVRFLLLATGDGEPLVAGGHRARWVGLETFAGEDRRASVRRVAARLSAVARRAATPGRIPR